MKSVLAVTLIATFALAAPQSQQDLRSLPAVSRTDNRDAYGQFASQYRTAEGTTFAQQGALVRTKDNKDNVLVQKGSYRYVSPEGVPVEVHYTADENGFHPISSSIPVPVKALPIVY